MEGMNTPVPAQPRFVKRAALRRHRATVAVRGWAARPPVAFLRLARKTREPYGLGSRLRRGGGGGLDPQTTKLRCVLPLRSLRGRSACGLTGGPQRPQRVPPLPPSPPTVATVIRDAVRGGGTHPQGIRNPHGCRSPEKV